MDKKLKLELDGLEVETFAPDAAAAGERGTVEAYLIYTDPRVCPYSNNWYCTVNERYCTTPADCGGTAAAPGDPADTVVEDLAAE